MPTSPITTEASAPTAPSLASASGVLTIDLGAIAENYRRLRKAFQEKPLAAVVKADAYGLGMAEVAPVLVKQGARSVFVAQLEEAIALRPVLDACHPAVSLYVLNGLMPGTEAAFIDNNILPVLNSLGEIDAWSRAAVERDRVLPAAIQLDSGMNRLGLPEAETSQLREAPERLQGIAPTCFMSHLACADDPQHPQNAEQLAAFHAARRGLPKAPASLCNSSGIFLGPDYHFDLGRPGAAVYGVNPTPAAPSPVLAVVRLQARILQVRAIDAPQSVGYGATHRATGPARIATVAAGYADGYLRSISGRGRAWVDGREVPVVGRISMDLLALDVTEVAPGAACPGQMVDLLGPQHGVDALAQEAGTIGYEILTALGRRYHRTYLG
ncbi:alanine racemase [Pelagibius litoralis]|uniref:Alanine racemase n=1 Tax=Pelagibius litoralis TaxID=374515 RepID=A0A967EZL4_9PROT|nr:alanine racemase [Pelagibius litoralis]NIA70310.1 alanine racemase [Pelagibius litoralis]